MTHWLYSANPKYYDVLGALAHKDAYWPKNTKVVVGDIVYIYLTAPYKQIGFLCVVKEIDMPEAAVHKYTKQFVKGVDAKPSPKKTKPFMKLLVKKRFPIKDGSPLSLEELKKHGLSGMLMGPRKLDGSPTLLQYVLSVN